MPCLLLAWLLAEREGRVRACAHASRQSCWQCGPWHPPTAGTETLHRGSLRRTRKVWTSLSPRSGRACEGRRQALGPLPPLMMQACDKGYQNFVFLACEACFDCGRNEGSKSAPKISCVHARHIILLTWHNCQVFTYQAADSHGLGPHPLP